MIPSVFLLVSIFPRALFLLWVQIHCSHMALSKASTVPPVVFWIEENLAKGSPVGQLSPTYGRDTIDLRSVRYTSLAQDTVAQYFRVDASDGTIYAMQTIDREALCDEQSLAGTNTANDFVVRRIRATDNLPMSQLLINNSVDNPVTHKPSDQFRPQRAIDIFSSSLQTSTTCRVNFQVHAALITSDGMSDSVVQDVQIMIADVNDNKPTFSSDIYILKILESSPIDAEFRLPTAHDGDSGMHGITLYRIERINPFSDASAVSSNALCRLSTTTEAKLAAKLSPTQEGPNNDNKRQVTTISYPFAGDYFVMHSQRHANGHLQPQLKQIRPLDREQTEALYLCLIAQDGGGNEGALAVKIELLDANDNVPQWQGLPYKVSLSECDPPGEYIVDHRVHPYLASIGTSASGLRHLITLQADDKDLGVNGECVFRLGQQSATGGTRRANIQMPSLIVKENKVFLASKLDHESLPHFFIPVEVVDGGGLVNYTEIEVTVADCNDHAPVIMVIPLKTQTVSKDHNRTGKAGGASDGGASINIPQLGLPTDPILYLEEEHLARIDLATVMAYDRDKIDAGRVTCRLEQHKMTPSHVSYFDLVPVDRVSRELQASSNSDSFMTSASMFTLYKREGVKVDREKTASIVLSVLCTDNGSVRGHETRKLVYIQVLDINDNAPKIIPSDYTPQDQSTPFVTQTFVVSENQPFGTLIGVVRATDPDENQNAQLQYAFLEPPYPPNWTVSDVPLSTNTLTELFELDRNTGRLYTHVSLDRESNASFIVYVKVMDSGIPQLTTIARLQILVSDVNDNPPRFKFTEGANGRVVFHTQESDGERPIHGRMIGQLVTQDDDLGSNQTVHFSLVEGSLTPIGLPVTYRVTVEGKIYADGLLDREQCGQHQFTVRAVDGGPVGHQLTASAVIIVNLDDLNDSPPQFVHPPGKTVNGIPSDLINITVRTPPGSVIYHVQATDMDQAINTKLNFHLRSAKFLSNYFTLRPTGNSVVSKSTGFSEGAADLILVNSLAELPAIQSNLVGMHTIPKEYFVYIIVKDNDEEPSHSATARLRIHVYQDRALPTISSVELAHSNESTNHLSSTVKAQQSNQEDMKKLESADDGTDTGTFTQFRYHKTTGITVILILAILIVCVFLGIFCFVAFLYLRGTQTRGPGSTPHSAGGCARKSAPFAGNADLNPPAADDVEQLAYWELLNHNYMRTAGSEHLHSEASSADQIDGAFDGHNKLPYLLTNISPPTSFTGQFTTSPTQLSTMSRRDNRLTGALLLDDAERPTLTKDSTEAYNEETMLKRISPERCQLHKSSVAAEPMYTTNADQSNKICPVYIDGNCFGPYCNSVHTFDSSRMPVIKSCFKPTCQYEKQNTLPSNAAGYADTSWTRVNYTPNCSQPRILDDVAGNSCGGSDHSQQAMSSPSILKQEDFPMSQLMENNSVIAKKQGVKFHEHTKYSTREDENIHLCTQDYCKLISQDGRGSAPATFLAETISSPGNEPCDLLQTDSNTSDILDHRW